MSDHDYGKITEEAKENPEYFEKVFGTTSPRCRHCQSYTEHKTGYYGCLVSELLFLKSKVERLDKAHAYAHKILEQYHKNLGCICTSDNSKCEIMEATEALK